jgi:hypothetical protein
MVQVLDRQALAKGRDKRENNMSVEFRIEHARKDGASHTISVDNASTRGSTEAMPVVNLEREEALALAEQITSYYRENSPRRRWLVEMSYSLPVTAPAYMTEDDVLSALDLDTGPDIEADDTAEFSAEDDGIVEDSE